MPNTPTIRSRRGLATAGLCAAIAAALAGCSDSSSSAGPAATAAPLQQTKDLTIGYIVKRGTDPFAADQVDAAKALAAKDGVTLLTADVKQDTSLAISTVDQMLAQGAKGIIIVVPDQSIGPAVLRAAEAKGAVVVASDDAIKDASGTAAPFVGLDGATLGRQAGKALADQLAAKSWNAPTTAFVNVVLPSLTVCNERTGGADSAFAAAVPDFAGKKLDVSYDGTLAQALTSMNAAITSNPGIKNWLITGCNDDGVAGALRALEGKGVTNENSVGLGMDGALVCSELSKDNGFYGANYVSFAKNGQLAYQALVDHLTKGTAIPPTTFVPGPLVTRENYKQIAGC